MSLCPSSSHQLVAAAIAFRRARRRFPKDFGLDSALERASKGNPRESPAKEGTSPTKAETTTTREGPINQERSSSSLVRRAYSSRSEHICPASVRCRDQDRSCSEEGSIGCSCCRTRNVAEDISELRNDCSGDHTDTVDVAPGRECDQSVIASSADRKNEFAKPAERDRCDVTSRTGNGEAVKAGCIPQSAHSTFCYHRKVRCSSKPCPNLDATKVHDYASCERNDKIACGDSSRDRSKEFALNETSDFDNNAEEDIVSGDTHGPAIEGWMKLDASRKHCQKTADSTCRYHCECQEYQKSSVDLLRSSCDSCHHHHDHHRDCFHWHCCCQQRDDSFVNANECEASYGISGGKAQHKSWREQMRGEDGRFYARQCSSKNYPGIISAACEESDELVRDENDNDDDNEEENVGNDDGEDNEEDDDDVAVINHKDSMCILAEKYKTSRKSRTKRCAKDNCKDKSQNKSQTSEAIDQPRESPRGNVNAIPHEQSASVKYVCRVGHCEGCGTVRACRDRGRRQAPPEGEYDRIKCPLNETRCCSSRAPCGRTF